MKQKEKTKKTYEKIMNAAIKEFGTKNYADSSLNNICINNKISKGLIYHNFKNKDELYLKCIEVCFNEITSYLQNFQNKNENIFDNIQSMLLKRQSFFKENPYYSYIFFQAIIYPPKHLIKEIQKIRKNFDNLNLKIYRELIKKIELRDGITEEMAIQYFLNFQEMFNQYFQTKDIQTDDISSVIANHEMRISNFLNIMLYGIAKRESKGE